MFILLPPSEGKSAAHDGPPVDLSLMSSPELMVPRRRVLTALTKLCAGRVSHARKVLGLSANQDVEIELNRLLFEAPTAAAADVYTGVVYDFMGYRTLPGMAQRRLNDWVIVSSALWGMVRLTDHIPAYRLSGDVALPRIGALAQFWRKPLTKAMPNELGADGPILDLRSGTYAKMCTPSTELAQRTAVGRVLQQFPDGSTKVVSHHNKATKGRLVRGLASQSRKPQSVSDLADLIASLGYSVNVESASASKPVRLDIVVRDL